MSSTSLLQPAQVAELESAGDRSIVNCQLVVACPIQVENRHVYVRWRSLRGYRSRAAAARARKESGTAMRRATDKARLRLPNLQRRGQQRNALNMLAELETKEGWKFQLKQYVCEICLETVSERWP